MARKLLQENYLIFSSIKSLKKQQWRYVRLTFADLWYEGIQAVLKSAATKDYSKETLAASTGFNHLDFSNVLVLQPDDLCLLKITLPGETIFNHVKEIESSTRHSIATTAICGLMSVLYLPHGEEHLPERIYMALRRYVSTEPGSRADEEVFVQVVCVLKKLIDIGYDKVLEWALIELNDGKVFFNLLRDCSRSLYAYNEVGRLFKLIIKKSAWSSDQDTQDLLYNMAMKLFETIAGELRDADKDRIPVLVGLLQTLTHLVPPDSDEGLVMQVIKNLFTYIQVMKPTAQTGSYIVKNCLLTIEHLLPLIKEPNIDRYLKHLAGLCSHGDYIIRAAAWNVLATYASRLKGAESIVAQLAHFPGGIHATTLATICDDSEFSVVKGAATRLFISLLQHKDSEKRLEKAVMPRSTEQEPKDGEHGYDVILAMMNRECFFDSVAFQLENFAPNIVQPEDEGFSERYTTPPTTVIYLCSLMTALWDLRTNNTLQGIEMTALEMFLG